MQKTLVRTAIAGLLVLAAVGPAAVGPASADDRGGRPDANGTRTTVVRVRIIDFAFRPGRIEVARGSRVRWTNAGSVTHTTTSTTGVWDSGSLAPGEAFSRVFRSRGTFRYACTIHAGMTGKVVVR